MAVDDAFRVARGAARVTHGGGLTFVDLGPFVAGGFGGEQFFVVEDLAERRGVAFAHQDESGSFLQFVHHSSQQRNQRSVHQDHVVFGVVDHVGELLGEETDVQRMQHGAHARDGKVGFEMFLVVPLESGDTVAGTDAQSFQRGGELFGSFRNVRKAGPSSVVPLEGHDLTVCEDPLAMAKDGSDGKRFILHGALEHGVLLGL